MIIPDTLSTHTLCEYFTENKSWFYYSCTLCCVHFAVSKQYKRSYNSIYYAFSSKGFDEFGTYYALDRNDTCDSFIIKGIIE